MKTEYQAKHYFEKLCKYVGDECQLNYYKLKNDNDTFSIDYESNCKLERVIRIIPIKEQKAYHSNDTFIGVIALNLDNIQNKDAEMFYNNVIKKIENMATF